MNKTALQFPRHLRLANAKEYRDVFQSTFRLKSRYVSFHIKTNEHSQPRLGLVIAKKNVRSAVMRNRLKRLLREGFRLRQHQLPEIDIVIVVYRGLETLVQAEQYQFLEQQWQKLIAQSKRVY